MIDRYHSDAMPLLRRLRELLPLSPRRQGIQLAPELLALTQEPSGWKRWLRVVWCFVLLLTGQLTLMVRTMARRRPSFRASHTIYQSPLRHAVLSTLHGVRAPPQPA